MITSPVGYSNGETNATFPAMASPVAAVATPHPLHELMQRRQWFSWKYEPDPDPTRKPRKRPYTPGMRRKAKPNDPRTCGTYAAAIADVRAGRADGVGYLFTAADDWFGIDLDDCIDLETGEIAPWALHIVETFGTYTERTPSGAGLHLIGIGTKPDTGCTAPAPNGETGKIECYDQGRYFTVTGQTLAGYDRVTDCRDTLAAWHRATWPPVVTTRRDTTPTVHRDTAAIVDKAMNASNGPKFRKLYIDGDTSAYGGDDNRADAALLGILVLYTRDPDQLLEIWQASALQREKLQRADYVERTINFVLKNANGTTWRPDYQSRPAASTPQPDPPLQDAGCPYDTMTREELIAQLQQRDATLQAVRIILETPNMQLGPRVTAIGTALAIADEIEHGRRPKANGWAISAPRVAKLTGQSEDSVFRHMRDMEKKGALPRKVVEETIEREWINPTTGEITPPGTKLLRGYIRTDGPRNLAEHVASYVRVESDAKHGGDRPTCPKHPDAGTVTSTRITCRECGDLLHESVTYQDPAPHTDAVAPVATDPPLQDAGCPPGADTTGQTQGGGLPVAPPPHDALTPTVSDIPGKLQGAPLAGWNGDANQATRDPDWEDARRAVYGALYRGEAGP